MTNPAEVDLSVCLGPVRLPNPVLVASGTFGHATEMARWVDMSRLGGIVPKTVTSRPRRGNRPQRTVETACGMLNSIGLDNEGIDYFLAHQLPQLLETGAPVIVSVAGENQQDFVELAARVSRVDRVTAVELNISCPNVAHGVDFSTDAELCFQVVSQVRRACGKPLWVKLSPNVTDIRPVAEAAERAGADALTLINTCVGMAVDWRRRRPMLGAVTGGLSGPAIKPIALAAVYRVRQVVGLPLVGVGGIATVDDVLEFLVTGASAVQVGTANFFRPRVTMELLEQLPRVLRQVGCLRVQELIGTLQCG